MYTPVEKSFALTPAGNHIAICYQFVDLGTQESIFGKKRTVSIRWELCNELMDDGRPFSISRKYNWSMNKASSFRHMLETWRGRPFSADELNGNNPFDTKNLLGKPCMVSVMHKTVGDREYANVESVASMPKGTPVPKQVNPSVYFALTPDRFDVATLNGLHEKIQEMIKGSPEYNMLMTGTPAQSNGAHHDELDDIIPF